MTTYAENIRRAAESIQLRANCSIERAVILGSGLSHIIELQADDVVIPYVEIEGMNRPSVATHIGQLVLRKQAGQTIAFCQGRLHLYEGHSPQDVAFMVYLVRALGAKQLVITNAAGALNKNYRPGDVMVIEDHINFTGRNPVVGQDSSLGERFADMSQAYPATIAAQAYRIASEQQLPIRMGVYAGVTGPTLETSAERRMLNKLGADAVGMSTVIEVIAANHCGLRVCGLSAITNMATGDAQQQIDTLDDVLKNAAVAAISMKNIIWPMLQTPIEQQ
jgi:purine-nucleoside phosphorylase